MSELDGDTGIITALRDLHAMLAEDRVATQRDIEVHAEKLLAEMRDATNVTRKWFTEALDSVGGALLAGMEAQTEIAARVGIDIASAGAHASGEGGTATGREDVGTDGDGIRQLFGEVAARVGGMVDAEECTCGPSAAESSRCMAKVHTPQEGMPDDAVEPQPEAKPPERKPTCGLEGIGGHVH